MGKKDKVKRSEPRRICTASSKGGVTKTSTTLELAAQLAEMGDTVLILDLDSSSDLSTKLGLFNPEDEDSYPPLTLINAIVSDKRDTTKLADIVCETPYENLLIAPSDAALGEEFIAMKGGRPGPIRLRDVVDEYLADNPDNIDWLLIDCPADIGPGTEAGIAAADEILVPVDLKDEKAVDAIYNVAELAWQMRGDGPKDGIFVVQVKHLKQAPSVDRNMDLVNDNPFPVAKTIVPDRRAVFNFHNDNRLLAYGADSKGGKEASKTYKKLAKEIRSGDLHGGPLVDPAGGE